MYMKNPNLTENCKRMTNINSAGTEKYRIDFFFNFFFFSVYTCIPMCVHMPAGSRGQASGGATCGKVDRHILCLVGKMALGPASADAELVKAKPDCAVLFR